MREMREGRRDAQGLSELNLDEVLPGFHTPCTPDKQGAADLSAPRIPPSLLAVMLRCVMLCYVMLCYVLLCLSLIHI